MKSNVKEKLPKNFIREILRRKFNLKQDIRWFIQDDFIKKNLQALPFLIFVIALVIHIYASYRNIQLGTSVSYLMGLISFSFILLGWGYFCLIFLLKFRKIREWLINNTSLGKIILASLVLAGLAWIPTVNYLFVLQLMMVAMLFPVFSILGPMRSYLSISTFFNTKYRTKKSFTILLGFVSSLVLLIWTFYVMHEQGFIYITGQNNAGPASELLSSQLVLIFTGLFVFSLAGSLFYYLTRKEAYPKWNYFFLMSGIFIGALLTILFYFYGFQSNITRVEMYFTHEKPWRIPFSPSLKAVLIYVIVGLISVLGGFISSIRKLFGNEYSGKYFILWLLSFSFSEIFSAIGYSFDKIMNAEEYSMPVGLFNRVIILQIGGVIIVAYIILLLVKESSTLICTNCGNVQLWLFGEKCKKCNAQYNRKFFSTLTRKGLIKKKSEWNLEKYLLFFLGLVTVMLGISSMQRIGIAIINIFLLSGGLIFIIISLIPVPYYQKMYSKIYDKLSEYKKLLSTEWYSYMVRRKKTWSRKLIHFYLGYTAAKDFYKLLSDYPDGLLREEIIDLLGRRGRKGFTGRQLAGMEMDIKKSRYIKKFGLLYEKIHERVSGKDTYRYKLKEEYKDIIKDYFKIT